MSIGSEPLRFWDAAADLPQRRAVDFQRHVGRRLESLRAALGSQATHVVCGNLRIDLLDALRAMLVSRLGAALAGHELLAELRRRYPDRTIEVDRRPATADLRASLEDSPLAQHVHFPTAQVSWTTSAYRAAIDFVRPAAEAWRRRRAQSAVPQPVDWLVFPRMPGHLTDLIPLTEHARRVHGLRLAFASTNRRLAARLAESGHRLIDADLLPASLRRTIAAAVRQWKADWAAVARSPQTASSADDGLSPELIRLARNLVQASAPDVISTAYFSDWMLRTSEPKLVLLGNPYTYEGRVMGAVAQAAGIPTAAVQHGTVCADDPSWENCAGDLICAWGETSRQALLADGIEPVRVVATGAPRYDAVLAKQTSRAVAPNAARTILAAASGAGDKVTLAQHKHYIRVLYEAAALTPELTWIAKLHRKDRREYYPAANLTPANLQILDADYEQDGVDIFTRLADACALVTVSSTAALDAAVLGVPAITVNVWPEGTEPTEIDFLTDGTTTPVRTAAELATAARRAFAGDLPAPGSESRPARYFANPGKACAAVVAQLLQLTAPRNSSPAPTAVLSTPRT